MANVEATVIRQEAMTSLVMDSHKSTTYPEVQMRNRNSVDCSETQRKKRAKNRLSNRRSTGYVFEEDIAAALKQGPTGDRSATTNN